MKTLDQHIEVTADVVGGKPHIAGRRITVEDIVIWHERLGKSVDEIATEHELSLADIHAALAYYFDNRSEIDQQMANSKAFVHSLKQNISSKITSKLHAVED